MLKSYLFVRLGKILRNSSHLACGTFLGSMRALLHYNCIFNIVMPDPLLRDCWFELLGGLWSVAEVLLAILILVRPSKEEPLVFVLLYLLQTLVVVRPRLRVRLRAVYQLAFLCSR